jgi:hypothetical protein
MKQSKFVQYLAALALAAVPTSSALASTPRPARPAADEPTAVDFAANLPTKLAAADDDFVFTQWSQIVHAGDQGDAQAASATEGPRPSDVFRSIVG